MVYSPVCSKLALVWHPDVASCSQEEAKQRWAEVSSAYEELVPRPGTSGQHRGYRNRGPTGGGAGGGGGGARQQSRPRPDQTARAEAWFRHFMRHKERFYRCAAMLLMLRCVEVLSTVEAAWGSSGYKEVFVTSERTVGGVAVTTEDIGVTLPSGKTEHCIVERWWGGGRPRQRTLENGWSERTRIARRLFGPEGTMLTSSERHEAMQHFGTAAVLRAELEKGARSFMDSFMPAAWSRST
ncbi:hypothetical protein JKP88DRAFT_307473 [Tribonema minus]|uniref:J domain-containing protein n=1 Tax=Tribonema minus TaxID=303371 RepID=A0A836CJ07_9STRA|nr:hypothetical protein JKP88DRAFT_307473 [Tribonema minus]